MQTVIKFLEVEIAFVGNSAEINIVTNQGQAYKIILKLNAIEFIGGPKVYHTTTGIKIFKLVFSPSVVQNVKYLLLKFLNFLMHCVANLQSKI